MSRQRGKYQPVCDSFLARFAHHVVASPDALAVKCGNDSLTYRELDAVSRGIADTLQHLGARCESRIGLVAERSLRHVVRVLAIWMAGAAFIPIDPALPPQLVAAMCEDADLSLVFGRTAGLPDRAKVVLDVDAVPSVFARTFAPADDRLAYVLFTSGTTGRAKGVMCTQVGVAYLAQAHADVFPCEPGSRVLQFSSWSWDASIFELLMALSQGASLHLWSGPYAPVGSELATFITQEQVTHVVLTPTVLRTLEPEEVPTVRVVVSAGESLDPALAARWLNTGRSISNAYGPTEATVCATAGVLGPASLVGSSVAIGRSLPGASTVVAGEPQGELHVGGVGLARGYLGAPALTAAAFIPDAGSADGTRLYRTGDVVRLSAAEELIFIGRSDGQVKIGGVRVELGDIEAAARALDDVADAAAVAEQLDGTSVIALYASPRHPFVNADVVRASLRRTLPPSLVPTRIALVRGGLPRTPNGKLDRSALVATSPTVAALDHVDAVLAQMWAELFGAPVDASTNFFDAGGTSLLATRAIARIRQLLGVGVRVLEMFEAVDLGEIARLVRERRTQTP